MQGSGLSTILMLVLMVAAFWFLLIRPQKKRQQEAVKMQNSLTPGTRVMTTTGLFGTISAVDNEDVVIEIAPGVETRWVKAAIGRVVTPGDEPVETGDAQDSSATEETPAKEESTNRDSGEDSIASKS